jgi:hypothetical protein
LQSERISATLLKRNRRRKRKRKRRRRRTRKGA